MGYVQEELTKLSHDEGIDVIINKDALGLEKIYVQAKRWQQNIGRVDVQKLVGALSGKKANGGFFITTSGFSSTADQYVTSIPQNVVLVDGNRLAELMIKHEIGVSSVFTYELKRIDKDFFEQE